MGCPAPVPSVSAKRGIKVFLPSALLAGALLACGGAGGSGSSPRPAEGPTLPRADAVISLAGLSGPVHVFTDTYGIPHIYGSSESDVLFVQGYLHARDRFTEMDLLRHISSGRVAELTGQMPLIGPAAGYLTATTVDWLMRALSTTRQGTSVVSEVLARASPEVMMTMESFCKGVNAYIRDLRHGTNGAKLAPYYKKLFGVSEDRIPEYAPEDIVSLGVFMGFFLSNLQGLIEHATFTDYFKAIDTDVLSDTLRSAPADPTTILPGLPVTAAAAGLPWASRFAKGPKGPFEPLCPRIGKGTVQARDNDSPLTPFDIVRFILSLLGYPDRGYRPGSNNWVLAPSLTERGYALVANDQHLAALNPPLYYHSHLDTTLFGGGDLDVIGVSFAGFPGVTTGHNEYVAWGQTVMGYDQIDLYKETVLEQQYGLPKSVLFQGRAVPTATRWERFQIGYGPHASSVTLPIVFTEHHGPVLPYSTRNGSALSVRWVGQEPFEDSEALILIEKARTVHEIAAALRHMELAAFNWVYADTDGNIGYSGPAKVPVVAGTSRYPPYLILPGTGEAEWQGFVPQENLPFCLNPPEGYINTSNNDVFGTTLDNDPLDDPVYYYFTCDIGFRAHRVRELIASVTHGGGKATFEDMMRWQGDTVSLAARRLLPFLFEAAREHPEMVSPRTAEALERLAAWDLTSPTGIDAFYRAVPPDEDEKQQSRAATIFHAWLNHLLASTFSDDYARYGVEMPGVDMLTKAMLFLLEHPDQARTGEALFDDAATPDRTETPGETLLGSLESALGFLEGYFKTADMNQWEWGKLHTTSFLLGYEDVSLPFFPIQGPFPTSGANFTVNASDVGADPTSYTNTYGPNTRLVVELEPGVMRAVNAQPGGQSERPESPHYADLTELWLDHRYHELYFLFDDVLAHREDYTLFTPSTEKEGHAL
jgi:penicillin amidase